LLHIHRKTDFSFATGETMQRC
jgi:hypothetical protein